MTDKDNALEDTQVDELTLLKQQATMMGITFSNNIGVEALRKKITAKMDDQQDTTDESGNEVAAAVVTPAAATTVQPAAEAAPVVMKSLAQHLKEQALRLVRIRISSMDPKKQDLPGEIFTVANEYIGTVKKYVPFGEQTDNGYHVPYCIYELLKSRQFLHVQTRTGNNGQIETKTRWVKEFNIELLEDLTPAQLKSLAADQRATGRLDGEE